MLVVSFVSHICEPTKRRNHSHEASCFHKTFLTQARLTHLLITAFDPAERGTSTTHFPIPFHCLSCETSNPPHRLFDTASSFSIFLPFRLFFPPFNRISFPSSLPLQLTQLYLENTSLRRRELGLVRGGLKLSTRLCCVLNSLHNAPQATASLFLLLDSP